MKIPTGRQVVIHPGDEMSTTRDPGWDKRLPGWAMPLIVCLLTVAYVWPFVYRNWIPHDEGLLAQCAERVLQGELPHRDFDDTYTGGLTYLNALSFRLFGWQFSSSRTMLLVFVTAFVPVFYWVNSHFSPPLVAGFVTLAGVVLSLPNYFAALPSWYVLFLTVFGIAAHLKYLEGNRARWLLLAGFCGGFAIVFKITGIYYIAGCILFLLFREQVREDFPVEHDRDAESRAWLVTVVLGASGMILATLFLLRRHPGPETLGHFIIPIAGLCAILIARSAWDAPRAGWPRLFSFGKEVGIFMAGALIPVAIFLAPYLAGDATADLIRGVFITPQKRLDQAFAPLPPLTLFPLAAPLALVGMLGCTRLGRRDWAWTCLAVPAIIAILIAARRPAIEWLEFSALRWCAPIVILLGCWELRPRQPAAPPGRQQQLFLVLSTTALYSLSQYPFSVPIYFCYVAPLFVISAHAVITNQPYAPRRLHLALLAGLMAYAMIFLNRGSSLMPMKFRADDPPVHSLDLPRAGLLVSLQDKTNYETIVHTVGRLSSPGDYIYATPDCPEVYFLAERRNPTGTMYEMFDQPDGRRERILQMLDDREIDVVVINLAKRFSPIDHDLVDEVAKRFPHRQATGSFVIYSRHTSNR